LLIEFLGKTVDELSIQESALNAEKRHSQKRGTHTQVRASVDLKHRCSMRKTVRDGVNLHEESDSEQEREPYGGNHSAATDHSVGSGRRRIGFLHGFGLSPPLALAARTKQNILTLCGERCLGWPNRITKASAVPRARILLKCRIGREMPDTYPARYFPVALVSCFGIDSNESFLRSPSCARYRYGSRVYVCC
jgi:hypothetical protein